MFMLCYIAWPLTATDSFVSILGLVVLQVVFGLAGLYCLQVNDSFCTE